MFLSNTDAAVYGNFDIVLVPSHACLSAFYHPTCAVCDGLRSVHPHRVLISTCNPMVCPIWGIRHTETFGDDSIETVIPWDQGFWDEITRELCYLREFDELVSQSGSCEQALLQYVVAGKRPAPAVVAALSQAQANASAPL